MKFTATEIRELSAANGDRGWAAIPEGCPAKFTQIILESRARKLGLHASEQTAPVIPAAQAAPQVDVDALRAKLNAVSLF